MILLVRLRFYERLSTCLLEGLASILGSMEFYSGVMGLSFKDSILSVFSVIYFLGGSLNLDCKGDLLVVLVMEIWPRVDCRAHLLGELFFDMPMLCPIFRSCSLNSSISIMLKQSTDLLPLL